MALIEENLSSSAFGLNAMVTRIIGRAEGKLNPAALEALKADMRLLSGKCWLEEDRRSERDVDEEGISPDQFRLIFESEGSNPELKDGTTLSDYNIESGAVIRILMKPKIQDKEDMQSFEIVVHDRRQKGGLKLILDVKASDTTEDVKAKIQDKDGTPKEQQMLAYRAASGYEEMMEGSTLLELNIQKDAVLHLYRHCAVLDMIAAAPSDMKGNRVMETLQPAPSNMFCRVGAEPDQIFVVPLAGDTFQLDVKASDTIADVKDQITLKKGIAQDEQRLTFGGKQLENEQTLSQCDIQNEATLYLLCRLGGGMGTRARTAVPTYDLTVK
jgi:ubiquitin C